MITAQLGLLHQQVLYGVPESLRLVRERSVPGTPSDTAAGIERVVLLTFWVLFQCSSVPG